jgi:hypothetical protein
VELRKRQKELKQLKSEEGLKTTVQLKNNQLEMKASIGVFVEQEEEVKIVLTHGVYCIPLPYLQPGVIACFS